MKAWWLRMMWAAWAGAIMLGIGGCNTVKGIGQDIQDASAAVQEAMSD